MKVDAVVIGAGHNGLTTAALLAKSGRKIVVVEKRDKVGGLCALEEFHPGFKVPGVHLDTSGVRRDVAESLDLARHGLAFVAEEPPVFAPASDGPGLLLHRDPAKADAEIRAHSARDAKRYVEFRAFIGRVRGFIARLLNEPPPDLNGTGAGELWDLARTAIALRRLGADDMLEIARIAPTCVADWLNGWFECELLKAALAGPSLHGTFMGPWSSGTTATSLLQECVASGGVRGGSAALVTALHAAARAAGVDVRLGSAVEHIDVAGGRVKGVTLASRETIECSIVASSCDPKRTLLDLVAATHLAPRFAMAMRNYRMRGTSAKVHLALRRPLEFRARPGQVFEIARTGETLDELERAFDPVKYRKFSSEPILEIRVPSISSPELAPAGQHVASILVNGAPAELEGGWTDARRDELGNAVVNALARYAPGVRESIVAREVLTPLDIEQRYGVTGGHIHHGEHALDQLVMRPAPQCARYATPIEGLYLCGSGSHPGGGVTCAPGALAAKTIIERPARP
ncbi:MAG: NAD(P)/FAD-dependent oxidoreductase [Planctomycetes bacterium]|nr:NAD(P)/FAD-dependent oxidoreductase [Planctomycetota bacterium]MBI3843342.1 NAD(P)/FAD-dependent oxidoreductase [Planctomycetota bacterium]